MEKKAKKELPGASIGLYICAGIMFVLLALSVVGIFIGREDGTWPYFIGAALAHRLNLPSRQPPFYIQQNNN